MKAFSIDSVVYTAPMKDLGESTIDFTRRASLLGCKLASQCTRHKSVI